MVSGGAGTGVLALLPMSGGSILVYGANGRLGARICRLASERGIRLIAAGRNAQAVEAVAVAGGHESRVFGLDTPSTIDACFDGVHTVLNCAGPATSATIAVFEACLRMRVHHLDLTGDIDVVETLRQRSDEAASLGVMVMPAVGFTALAADMLAAHLVHLVAGPTRLDIVFCESWPVGPTSPPATVRSFVRGRLERHRAGWKKRGFRCGDAAAEDSLATPVDAAELVVLRETTGLDDITIWAKVGRSELLAMRAAGLLGAQALLGRARNAWARLERLLPAERNRVENDQGLLALVGEVRNTAGAVVAVRLETPDRVTTTIHAALAVALRAAQNQVRPGFQTPASLHGADFVLSLPGTKRVRLA
jgi:short subunit dehydrogenase-like uncharacterized protein